MSEDDNLADGFSFEVETLLLSIIAANTSVLDKEAVLAVRHYLDHAEYEMAFEGLFLELFNLENVKIDYSMSRILEMAKGLRLDSESVFESAFWSRLVMFLNEGGNDRRSSP